MRWRLAALGATLAVVAGSGAAYVAVHDDGASHRSRAVPTPTPQPVRGPALAALSATAPSPTRTALTRQLRQAAAAPELGGALAGLVVDAATGQRLFVRRPNQALPPASTTKLLTAIAALEVLGPDARLTTNVVRSGGTLYLVGGGDVTLAAAPRDAYPAPTTLADLAARTASAVAGTRFRVRYDDTLWQGPSTAAGWPATYVSGGNNAPGSALEGDEGPVTRFTSLPPPPPGPDPPPPPGPPL